MKAVIVREHGSLDVLKFEDTPLPSVKANEARIAVKACGMNHLDLWVRRGVEGHKFPLPMIPGCDASGVVEEAGSLVTNVKPGDEVMVLPGLSCGQCQNCLAGDDHLCKSYGIVGETRDGAYAEYLTVPSVNLHKKPAALSFEEAAALPLVFLTAWHMVMSRAVVKPGEWVLVHAAGSGVSSAAIQIAKLAGGNVIATTGSEDKFAKAKALGADHVLNYKDKDWPKQAKTITGGGGPNVIVDHAGEATWEGNMKCLAWAGRYVTCGSTVGHQVPLNLRMLFFKQQSFLGSTMGSKSELMRAIDLVGAGKMKAVVDSVLPLSEVREAHRRMEEGKQFGKIILQP